MPDLLTEARNVSFVDEHPDLGDGRQDIMAGLLANPKRVNPMWFYDQRGSELFDEITRLPEYYPTRTEVGILHEHRAAISARCGQGCVFIEPGSGSSEKARILLDALQPASYVPIDISSDYLQQAALSLGGEYPWLRVQAYCADFNTAWGFLDALPDGKRVVFYPGSTIGNLEPPLARQFLTRLAKLVGEGGGVLIGVDTHKSKATLNAAYNDSAGVTAQFNLNVLRRMNELLDADFDERNFRHDAFYNETLRRIEMHLVSVSEQEVDCGGQTLSFAEGESIHTENSYKYTPDDFAELAATAGFSLTESWLDDAGMFSVHYLELDAQD
ncbi:MAG: L-histidine N(alpha)-methyltransferase [Congregibacter sp.]